MYGELCYLRNIAQINIIESDIYNTGKLPSKGIQGLFITKSKLQKEPWSLLLNIKKNRLYLEKTKIINRAKRKVI